MTHRVVSSNEADADVADTAEYYVGTAGSEIAVRFIDAVEASTRRIASFPYVGSSAPEVETGIPGLRAIGVSGFPFRLLYTCDEDAIRVHRVLHDRRDLGAALAE